MAIPIQVGITGGIGSGKSTVAKIFQSLGIPVYDADSRAKSLMTTDGILISGIKKEFGVLAYHEDGSLNRTYLADHVFQHTEQLETLNRLVHPRVAEDYTHWLEEKSDSPYVLKEAALLYESGSYQKADKIIVVYAPKELRVRRVLKRDPHRTLEQVHEIMDNQLDDDVKLKRADFVIMNDEKNMVLPQVLELHKKFLGQENGR